MTYLVTGTAGFIGNHVALSLLQSGERVVGVDSVTDYYDVALKEARLSRLTQFNNFTEARIDIADAAALEIVFADHRPKHVIHLAAQAGVRHSLTHPRDYLHSNLSGFLNILEVCRTYPVAHLIYASTSSVYGANTAQPFSEHHLADHPKTFYAASKRANELMAHSYSHLFGIPTTGLRFFTVYGPWGRPDMAYFKFTKAILEGTPIDIYNYGKLSRDFTYVDDIVDGILRLVPHAPTASADWDSANPDPAFSGVAPYRIFNIGNNDVVPLMDFVKTLEDLLGVSATYNMMDMQTGDVHSTHADVSELQALTGFAPNTPLRKGLSHFVDWYRDFYSSGGA